MPRIEAAWNQLVELINQVEDAAGLNKVGTDGWTVKDHLAHVGAWEHSLLALVQGQDRVAAMGVAEAPGGTDAINQQIRKLHAKESPEEALAYFCDAHAQMVSALGKLSDADLQKPYSHFQPSDPDEK